MQVAAQASADFARFSSQTCEGEKAFSFIKFADKTQKIRKEMVLLIPNFFFQFWFLRLF